MSEADASYEVCVRVGTRWEIHARYPTSGASAAIEEAKQLEQATKNAVKVLREVFDDSTGLYKQVVVYKSSQLNLKTDRASPASSPASRGRGYRSRRGRRDEYNPLSYDPGDGFDDFEEEGNRGGFFSRFRRSPTRDEAGAEPVDVEPVVRPPRLPKRVTIAGLFGRIGLVILAGLLLAAAVTTTFPFLAPEMASRKISLAGGQTSALFAVFVAVFVVGFAILGAIFLTGLEVIAPQRPMAVRAAGPAAAAPRRRRRLSKAPEPILKPFDEEPSEPAPSELENGARAVDQAGDAGEEEEVENILDAGPEAEEAAEIQLSPAGEQHKATMMGFVQGVLQELSSEGDIDAFSRFGINLFLAGAVESLGTTQGLDTRDSHGVLSSAVQALGTPRDMAQKFADSAASYLMQPKYIEMYEIGRRSMMTFLEGDAEGAKQLSPALDSWRNPTKTEEKSGPLAVLFTDIVGSTNMTVTIGDEAAQYVVRTHNRIVRSALTNFSGREVKHTGDGIMASFSTVSNAVEAAIEMQRRVAANNAAEGDIPLHLCIGINAGEPVVEDDDLFGVTVQLSARLCAAAESDQILVSEVVKGLCSGKDVKFVARGTKEMKGFKEPVPLYEALWKENGAA